MSHLLPIPRTCHLLPSKPSKLPGYCSFGLSACGGRVLLLRIERRPATFCCRPDHRCRSYRVRLCGPKHLRPCRELVAFAYVFPGMTWNELHLLSLTYPLPACYPLVRFTPSDGFPLNPADAACPDEGFFEDVNRTGKR